MPSPLAHRYNAQGGGGSGSSAGSAIEVANAKLETEAEKRKAAEAATAAAQERFRLQREVDELRHQLVAAQSSADDTNSNKQEHENEIRRLQGEVRMLEVKANEQGEVATSARRELSEARQAAAKAELSLAAAEDSLATLESDYRVAMAAQANLQAEIKDKNVLVAELQASLAAMAEPTSDALVASVTELQRERTQLQAYIRKLVAQRDEALRAQAQVVSSPSSAEIAPDGGMRAGVAPAVAPPLSPHTNGAASAPAAEDTAVPPTVVPPIDPRVDELRRRAARKANKRRNREAAQKRGEAIVQSQLQALNSTEHAADSEWQGRDMNDANLDRAQPTHETADIENGDGVEASQYVPSGFSRRTPQRLLSPTREHVPSVNAADADSVAMAAVASALGEPASPNSMEAGDPPVAEHATTTGSAHLGTTNPGMQKLGATLGTRPGAHNLPPLGALSVRSRSSGSPLLTEGRPRALTGLSVADTVSTAPTLANRTSLRTIGSASTMNSYGSNLSEISSLHAFDGEDMDAVSDAPDGSSSGHRASKSQHDDDDDPMEQSLDAESMMELMSWGRDETVRQEPVAAQSTPAPSSHEMGESSSSLSVGFVTHPDGPEDDSGPLHSAVASMARAHVVGRAAADSQGAPSGGTATSAGAAPTPAPSNTDGTSRLAGGPVTDSSRDRHPQARQDTVPARASSKAAADAASPPRRLNRRLGSGLLTTQPSWLIESPPQESGKSEPHREQGDGKSAPPRVATTTPALAGVGTGTKQVDTRSTAPTVDQGHNHVPERDQGDPHTFGLGGTFTQPEQASPEPAATAPSQARRSPSPVFMMLTEEEVQQQIDDEGDVWGRNQAPQGKADAPSSPVRSLTDSSFASTPRSSTGVDRPSASSVEHTGSAAVSPRDRGQPLPLPVPAHAAAPAPASVSPPTQPPSQRTQPTAGADRGAVTPPPTPLRAAASQAAAKLRGSATPISDKSARSRSGTIVHTPTVMAASESTQPASVSPTPFDPSTSLFSNLRSAPKPPFPTLSAGSGQAQDIGEAPSRAATSPAGPVVPKPREPHATSGSTGGASPLPFSPLRSTATAAVEVGEDEDSDNSWDDTSEEEEESKAGKQQPRNRQPDGRKWIDPFANVALPSTYDSDEDSVGNVDESEPSSASKIEERRWRKGLPPPPDPWGPQPAGATRSGDGDASSPTARQDMTIAERARARAKAARDGEQPVSPSVTATRSAANLAAFLRPRSSGSDAATPSVVAVANGKTSQPARPWTAPSADGGQPPRARSPASEREHKGAAVPRPTSADGAVVRSVRDMKPRRHVLGSVIQPTDKGLNWQRTVAATGRGKPNRGGRDNTQTQPMPLAEEKSGGADGDTSADVPRAVIGSQGIRASPLRAGPLQTAAKPAYSSHHVSAGEASPFLGASQARTIPASPLRGGNPVAAQSAISGLQGHQASAVNVSELSGLSDLSVLELSPGGKPSTPPAAVEWGTDRTVGKLVLPQRASVGGVDLGLDDTTRGTAQGVTDAPLQSGPEPVAESPPPVVTRRKTHLELLRTSPTQSPQNDSDAARTPQLSNLVESAMPGASPLPAQSNSQGHDPLAVSLGSAFGAQERLPRKGSAAASGPALWESDPEDGLDLETIDAVSVDELFPDTDSTHGNPTVTTVPMPQSGTAVLPGARRDRTSSTPTASSDSPDGAGGSTQKLDAKASVGPNGGVMAGWDSGPAPVVPSLQDVRGWTAQFDTTYERTYFFNVFTGESCWTKPAAVADVSETTLKAVAAVANRQRNQTRQQQERSQKQQSGEGSKAGAGLEVEAENTGPRQGFAGAAAAKKRPASATTPSVQRAAAAATSGHPQTPASSQRGQPAAAASTPRSAKSKKKAGFMSSLFGFRKPMQPYRSLQKAPVEEDYASPTREKNGVTALSAAGEAELATHTSTPAPAAAASTPRQPAPVAATPEPQPASASLKGAWGGSAARPTTSGPEAGSGAQATPSASVATHGGDSDIPPPPPSPGTEDVVSGECSSDALLFLPHHGALRRRPGYGHNSLRAYLSKNTTSGVSRNHVNLL